MMQEFNYEYHVVSVITSGAVADQEFEYEGEYIFYKSGTGDISIKLNSPTKDAIDLSTKEDIEAPFNRFFLTTTTAVNVVLFISKPKEVRIGSKEVNVDQISKVEKTDSGTYSNVSIGLAAGLIVAANTDRKAVTIQNVDADNVCIGFDASVTMNNGLLLRQYSAITLDRYTGAVYGISSAAASDVRYLEEG